METNNISHRLKSIRLQKQFTLEQVAEKTGISKSTLSRWENGQRGLPLHSARKLARIYNVDINEFIGQSGNSTTADLNSLFYSLFLKLSDSGKAKTIQYIISLLEEKLEA